MEYFTDKQTSSALYEMIDTFPREIASLTASFVEHKDRDAFERVHKAYVVEGKQMCSNSSLNYYYMEMASQLLNEGVKYLHEKKDTKERLELRGFTALSNDELRSLRYMLTITQCSYANKAAFIQEITKNLDHETLTLKEWKKKWKR